ncbi:unnamed protein product, partial [Closterium sp. NIES-53]
MDLVPLRSSSPTLRTVKISQQKQQHCVELRCPLCVGESHPSVTIFCHRYIDPCGVRIDSYLRLSTSLPHPYTSLPTS